MSLVTISKVKGCFHKGYLPNWSEEKFLVKFAKAGSPPTYVLKELTGETLAGHFFEEEIQKVQKKVNIYKIECILAKRSKGKKRQVLVKWLRYPRKFKSWLDAKDVVHYA